MLPRFGKSDSESVKHKTLAELISPSVSAISQIRAKRRFVPLPSRPQSVARTVQLRLFPKWFFTGSSLPGFWHVLCCQSYWLKLLVDFKTSLPYTVTDPLRMDFSLFVSPMFLCWQSWGGAGGPHVSERGCCGAWGAGNRQWWRPLSFCSLASLHFYLSF